jgi:hypothetical protein
MVFIALFCTEAMGENKKRPTWPFHLICLISCRKTCLERKSEVHNLVSFTARAITQAVSRRLPTAAARVRTQVRWDLWWTEWHWGQVFSEYFGFPCQFAFHLMLHSHHHHLSSGAGTVGQTVAAVPGGLSLTPHGKEKVKLCTPWRRMGEWMYRPTFSWPRH